MDHLRGLPGTTVRIETDPDGRVVATIFWDGVSSAPPIWWGSDEMSTLTPEKRTARSAIAPVLAMCARHAAPARLPVVPAPKTSRWKRVLAALA